MSTKNQQIAKNISLDQIITEFHSQSFEQIFENMLSQVYPHDNLQKTLLSKLCKDNQKLYNTNFKNVNNWFKGRHLPSREECFHICFLLDFTEEQANQFLACASDFKIHYRNPRELIYAYGLKTRRSWKDITQLCDQILPLYKEEKKRYSDTNDQSEQKAIETSSRQIEAEFHEQVITEEDLKQFILNKGSSLGTFHVTAYYDFLALLHFLQQSLHPNKKISVATVASQYLNMGITQRKNSSQDMDYIKKTVLRHWPTRDHLYKIQNHSQDINRKTMILLLFLAEEFISKIELPSEPATESSITLSSEQAAEKDLAIEYNGESRTGLQDHLQFFNHYLDLYGMNPLDFGHPFDYLIINSLYASQWSGQRPTECMQKLLAILFQADC